MEEIDEQLVTDIHRCPEKLFPQFLFGADTLKTVELLNRLILLSNGYETVIDCLSCWQDVIGASYCLEPVAAELQQCNSDELLYQCLSLINQLLLFSPNAISKIRVQHELKGQVTKLEVGDKIQRLREQKRDIFGVLKRKIDEQIQLWYSDKVQNCNVHSQGRSSSIAESEGTNSSMESDEEQVVANVAESDQGGEKTVEEIVHLLKSILNQRDDLIRSQVLRDICSAVLDKHTAIGLIKLIKQQFNIIGDFPVTNAGTSSLTIKPATAPPPPPPPPPVASTNVTDSHKANSDTHKRQDLPATLKPKLLPRKGTKLKQIQWIKLPTDKVFNELSAFDNIFMAASELSDHVDASIDLNELERKFSLSSSIEESTADKYSAKKTEALSLLTNKRSFNVNIFLKQFKEGAEQLLGCLRNGDRGSLQIESLHAFLNILPEREEVDLLRGFEGEVSQLGPAEIFFLNLISIPSYRLKLECLILNEELQGFRKHLEPSIDMLITACKEIQSSKMLPKVFCILVKIGNFLNAYGSSGNAAGFKLNSLWKVVDVKASKTSFTILHFVELQDPSTISALIQEFKHVSEASKLSFDNIKSDFLTMSERIEKQVKQIRAAEEPMYFDSFLNKLYIAEEEFLDLDDKIKRLNNTVKNLADYFCEDVKTFKLEECLKIFAKFIQRLQLVAKENKIRQKRERIRSHIVSRVSMGAIKPDETASALERQRRKVTPEMEKTHPVHSSAPKTSSDEENFVSLSRHYPHHSTEAFFIKNYSDLNDFLNAAERIEEVWRLNTEDVDVLIEGQKVDDKTLSLKGRLPAKIPETSQTVLDEGFESDKSAKSTNTASSESKKPNDTLYLENGREYTLPADALPSNADDRMRQLKRLSTVNLNRKPMSKISTTPAQPLPKRLTSSSSGYATAFTNLKYSRGTTAAPHAHVIVTKASDDDLQLKAEETIEEPAPVIPNTPVPARPTNVAGMSASEIAERELAGKSPLLNAAYLDSRRIGKKKDSRNISSKPLLSKTHRPSEKALQARPSSTNVPTKPAKKFTAKPEPVSTQKKILTRAQSIVPVTSTYRKPQSSPSKAVTTTKQLSKSENLKRPNTTENNQTMKSKTTNNRSSFRISSSFSVRHHYLTNNSDKKPTVSAKPSKHLPITASTAKSTRLNTKEIPTSNKHSVSSMSKISNKTPSFCSTTSRPSLIKTGSKVTKPEWR